MMVRIGWEIGRLLSTIIVLFHHSLCFCIKLVNVIVAEYMPIHKCFEILSSKFVNELVFSRDSQMGVF